MSPNWALKIHAFLHDPPNKPLALGMRGGHAAFGEDLAHRLTGVSGAEWSEVIRRADQLASGAERFRALPDVAVSLDDLRHPLSGRRIDLSAYGRLDDEARSQAATALREEIDDIAKLEDMGARFVELWGNLGTRLRRRAGTGELGALWELLPAETRMPNHPVMLHLALTSALASILASEEEPALLSFAIGPVQSFIATARRTSDLTAGSRMLSDALLEAVGPVVRGFGPDHVIFPSLRVSRSFREWVEKYWMPGFRSASGSDAMAGGALPNRFVAVLPGTRAASAARECERAVRDWWEAEARKRADELAKIDEGFLDFPRLAVEQIGAWLQVHWSTSPWPAARAVEAGDASVRRASWANGGAVDPDMAAFLRHDPNRRAFRANGGALYGLAFSSVEALQAGVKRSRIFAPAEEDGLKCSLCGERAVSPRRLSGAPRDEKERWNRLRARLSQGMLRRAEALCGVCWTKRSRGWELKQVPSTAEIATSPFKLAVLRAVEGENLVAEVQKLVEAVEAASSRGSPEAWTVPAIAPDRWKSELARAFARVRGEYLLRYPREERDDDKQIDERVLLAAKALRRAAREHGIEPPRPYLAALAMDGDGIGRWLSGANNRKLGEYLSLAAKAALGDAEDLERVWPMTPALHASISEACATFSQSSAPRTLHREGLPGFLVYAGGDDVLALTPIGLPPGGGREIATECALRLRLRFSGQVERSGRGDVVVPEASEAAGFVVDPEAGVSLAMGGATASAGIVVFHQRWPLGRALAEARAAEEHAKGAEGKNSLCIRILRRSGQITQARFRFTGPAGSEVRGLQEMAAVFADGLVSPRFVSEAHRRFHDFGAAAVNLEPLVRPLLHEALSGHLDPRQKQRHPDAHARLDGLLGARDAQGSAPAGEWLARIEAAAYLGRGEEP